MSSLGCSSIQAFEEASSTTRSLLMRIKKVYYYATVSRRTCRVQPGAAIRLSWFRPSLDGARGCGYSPSATGSRCGRGRFMSGPRYAPQSLVQPLRGPACCDGQNMRPMLQYCFAAP